jgi:hypothetical protein
LLRTGTVAAKPSWLLWEASSTIATAGTTIASVAALVELLLLGRGVDGGRGLLVDSHAELLDVCELALHSGHGGCLALHQFLRGGVRGAKVCKRFTVQCDQRVVVHGGHAIPMLRGWDRRLVDECDRVDPILFEGVDHLGDWRSFILVGNPTFVFLGGHPSSLDDAQADVDDVAIVHWVAGRTRVGSTDEEASCEGLKAVGGMPVGGHSLSILFAIFCYCFAVLHDEPIKYV